MQEEEEDNTLLAESRLGFPPNANIYGSYEALFDDPDVDALYLPLPTSLHVRWAVLVAEKKKHLLLEKPVALNVQEFDRIVATCDSNGVQLMDGTMWMHHPRTAMLREILSDSQRFGQLKSPRIDDNHLKWLHLRIRPSTLPFMDPLKSEGKAKAKALIDGR